MKTLIQFSNFSSMALLCRMLLIRALQMNLELRLIPQILLGLFRLTQILFPLISILQRHSNPGHLPTGPLAVR